MEAVKMVKLVCGSKGTGKTRKMIEMGNDSINTVKGKVFFLEANNKHIFDLNHDIKYINTKDFGIDNPDQFLGFAYGLLAADYDIELVYIDGLYKIANIEVGDLEDVVTKLETASEKFEVDFVMSVSFDENQLTPEMKEYIF